MAFPGATGSLNDPQNPTMWPIDTVQKDGGELRYPMAGRRVPGAVNVFNFLAQPDNKALTPSPNCAAPGCIPTMSNSNWTGTALVDGMIAQWMACTVSPTPACRLEERPFYADVNQAFQTNYAQYFAQCGPSPAFQSGWPLSPAPTSQICMPSYSLFTVGCHLTLRAAGSTFPPGRFRGNI